MIMLLTAFLIATGCNGYRKGRYIVVSAKAFIIDKGVLQIRGASLKTHPNAIEVTNYTPHSSCCFVVNVIGETVISTIKALLDLIFSYLHLKLTENT